ncbi:MAG TPA: Rrf2 family transcriptional regulator, partial [Paracoccaceae bacterium]|nr:Rrf2 family transcriptional regulator [Paracoccaceae bacterium]
VIHGLALAGFVVTLRGRSGGLRLARPAAEVSVGSVVRAFESGVPFAECMETDGGACPLHAACRLRCVFAAALQAFYASLDGVMLAELVQDNAELADLLRAA